MHAPLGLDAVAGAVGERDKPGELSEVCANFGSDVAAVGGLRELFATLGRVVGADSERGWPSFAPTLLLATMVSVVITSEVLWASPSRTAQPWAVMRMMPPNSLMCARPSILQ